MAQICKTTPARQAPSSEIAESEFGSRSNLVAPVRSDLSFLDARLRQRLEEKVTDWGLSYEELLQCCLSSQAFNAVRSEKSVVEISVAEREMLNRISKMSRREFEQSALIPPKRLLQILKAWSARLKINLDVVLDRSGSNSALKKSLFSEGRQLKGSDILAAWQLLRQGKQFGQVAVVVFIPALKEKQQALKVGWKDLVGALPLENSSKKAILKEAGGILASDADCLKKLLPLSPSGLLKELEFGALLFSPAQIVAQIAVVAAARGKGPDVVYGFLQDFFKQFSNLPVSFAELEGQTQGDATVAEFPVGAFLLLKALALPTAKVYVYGQTRDEPKCGDVFVNKTQGDFGLVSAVINNGSGRQIKAAMFKHKQIMHFSL